MNMGTNTLTREQLNEAIEQFADKIMEALGANVADEESSKPELTGTRFKVIDINGVERTVDATEIGAGTLIVEDVFEYFLCHTSSNVNDPWVRYSGRTYSHTEFAEEMRNADSTPRIVHAG